MDAKFGDDQTYTAESEDFRDLKQKSDTRTNQNQTNGCTKIQNNGRFN